MNEPTPPSTIVAKPLAQKKARSPLAILGFALALGIALFVLRDVVAYLSKPSEAEALHKLLHDGLLRNVAELRPKLPLKLDAAATLVDVKLDDVTTTYVNKFTGDPESLDMKALTSIVTGKICDGFTRNLIIGGAVYKYEYWSAADGKLIGVVTVSSCSA
jgi:hypothetical protein